MGEKRTAYMLLVGKPEGKIRAGGPSHRWIYNIKMALAEVGWGGVYWICLAQDMHRWREHSCKHSSEPSNYIKCWEIIKWLHNWWPLE
jgi:hypothetical protein